MKILLDFQNGMRAVTLNSEFSLCGLMEAGLDIWHPASIRGHTPDSDHVHIRRRIGMGGWGIYWTATMIAAFGLTRGAS